MIQVDFIRNFLKMQGILGENYIFGTTKVLFGECLGMGRKKVCNEADTMDSTLHEILRNDTINTNIFLVIVIKLWKSWCKVV